MGAKLPSLVYLSFIFRSFSGSREEEGFSISGPLLPVAMMSTVIITLSGSELSRDGDTETWNRELGVTPAVRRALPACGGHGTVVFEAPVAPGDPTTPALSGSSSSSSPSPRSAALVSGEARLREGNGELR